METTEGPSEFHIYDQVLILLDHEKRSCSNLHPNWTIEAEKPTLEQLYRGLGRGATALYVCSTLALLIVSLANMYFLVIPTCKNSKAQQKIEKTLANKDINQRIIDCY